MGNTNLLAILRVGDEDHYYLDNFFRSLPEGAKKVFDSVGKVGNLETLLRCTIMENKKNKWHFAIFNLQNPINYNELETEYFSKVQGAALIELQDELRIKVVYQQETLYNLNVVSDNYSGLINEMLKKYNQLSVTDPKRLIMDCLKKSELVRNTLVKNRFFSFGKEKLNSTYLSVGLETIDGEYLLSTTGTSGPYYATFEKNRFKSSTA